MSRAQLDSLYSRRLVYLGKYKENRKMMMDISAVDQSNVAAASHPGGVESRTKVSKRLETALRPTSIRYEVQKASPSTHSWLENDDVVLVQEDVHNEFLDVGETLLPEWASVGTGQEEEEEGEEEESWKTADFVKHADFAAGQATMATEPASAYPLSSTSATTASAPSHSSESQAMPNSRTTTTTVKSDSAFSCTEPPALATTFAHKSKQEIKEESYDEDGPVSLTSCAIILLSLGLRAIRHLIRSYQNLSLESEALSRFPRERKLSPQKAVAADSKASTQIHSTLSAEQFDSYDTEETHQHPEVATIVAAAAAEDTIVAAAEDATVTGADSMTDLEETCKTTSLQQTDPQLVEQQSQESSEKAFLQGRNSYSRTHSMLTVHTPDHRGFLGLPKCSHGSNGQGGVKQQGEQVGGAKLSHMLMSKPHNKNNGYKPPPHSRMSSKAQDEFVTRDAATAPAATSSTHNNHLLPPWTTTREAATTTSKEVPIAKQIAREAVLARVLVPPPSPLPPSESWFAATTSFRKPLGSFIREKHAGFSRKSASHQDQIPVTHPSNNNNNNSNNNNSQQICSSKDLLQRRQSFRPTVHAI